MMGGASHLYFAGFCTGGLNDDGHCRIVFLTSPFAVFLEDGFDVNTAIDEGLFFCGSRSGSHGYYCCGCHGFRNLRRRDGLARVVVLGAMDGKAVKGTFHAVTG